MTCGWREVLRSEHCELRPTSVVPGDYLRTGGLSFAYPGMCAIMGGRWTTYDKSASTHRLCQLLSWVGKTQATRRQLFHWYDRASSDAAGP